MTHANFKRSPTNLKGNRTNWTMNHTNWTMNHTNGTGNNTNLSSNHTIKARNHTIQGETRTTVMVKHTIMTTNDTRIYKTGCLKQSELWFKKSMWDILKVAISIGVIEVIGIICAICLWCSFGGKKGGKK